MKHHDPALAALTTEQRRTVWEIRAIVDAAQFNAEIIDAADPRDVPAAAVCGEADDEHVDQEGAR